MATVKIPRGKVWIKMDADPTHFDDSEIARAESWRPYSPLATVVGVGDPLPVVKRINGKQRHITDRCSLRPGSRIMVPSTLFGRVLQGGGEEMRVLTFEEVRDCLEVADEEN